MLMTLFDYSCMWIYSRVMSRVLRTRSGRPDRAGRAGGVARVAPTRYSVKPYCYGFLLAEGRKGPNWMHF